MKSNIYISTLLSLIVVFSSCQNSHTHDQNTDDHAHSNSNDESMDQHAHDGEIHLTEEQIKTMEIKLGGFTSMKINGFVKATGTLGLPPNAVTSLTARASGFIKDSRKFIPGDYVKRGSTIAYLENPSFIDMQQKYLEHIASLEYLRQEARRQKQLFESDAGIEKTVQKIKADLNAKEATVNGLAKQLQYLGIDPDKLTSENIRERIGIFAPMSGYITSINMHNGMYVNPENELMEIVDESHLHLELDVFEKDISGIRKEQEISYAIPAMGDKVYQGSVHVIGKEFNRENKTVRVHGHLEGDRPPFIKDLYLEAKIWLDDKTVNALPEEAIVLDNQFSYIYITDGTVTGDELTFEAIRIMPGNTEKGFTEIKLIDTIPDNHKIVTDGAFYVFAQSMASEMRHSH